MWSSGSINDPEISALKKKVCKIVGGVLSPLLANLLLDEFDKELEKRGHRFARDADDANSSVRSRQAGARVRARVTRVLKRTRRLKVNEAKSAVDRPWNRKCLGFTCTARRPNRRKVSEKALKAFNAKVREITSRTRGRTIGQIVQELRQLMLGWKAFFGFAEVRSPLRDLDKWIRRRLRSYHWKQWGRKRYRQLRKRGVGRQLAWNTVKSAHGPWRLSQSPALAIALPQRYFAALGLPSLIADSPSHLIRRTAVYVTRTYGGVGGREPRGSPLSRLAATRGRIHEVFPPVMGGNHLCHQVNLPACMKSCRDHAPKHVVCAGGKSREASPPGNLIRVRARSSGG
jgi:hypothetical protein